MKTKSISFETLFPPNMNYEYFEDHWEIPIPSTGTSGISIAFAWWAAEASLLAYEHPGFSRLVLRLIDATYFRSYSWEVTQALAFVLKSTCFVAFRGTEIKSVQALKDMSANLGYGSVPFTSGNVYRGFASAFSEMVESDDNVFHFIDDARRQHGCEEVVFCGHSLGGALATLAAVHYGGRCHLYTFGAPRVGDTNFVKSLPESSLRVVNSGDPVPLLPPSIRPFIKESETFVHGNLPYLLFDRSGNIKELKGGAKDGLPKPSLLEAVQRIGGGVASSLSTVRRTKASGDESIPAMFLSELAANTSMDAHAPIKYSTNLWNYIARQRD
jgi:hypothetical protein